MKLLLLVISFNLFAFTDINSNSVKLVDPVPSELEFTFKTSLKDIEVKLLDKPEWIRIDEVLVIPRLKVQLQYKKTKNLLFTYQSKNHFSQTKENSLFAYFYISPFVDDEVLVFKEGQKIGSIKFSISSKEDFLYIDKSCKKVNFDINRDKKHLMSIGCKFHYNSKDKKDLKISFAIANSVLLNKSNDIYSSFIESGSTLKFNYYGDKKLSSLSIRPQYKIKDKKLSLALGVGPYAFNTSIGQKSKDALSAAVMIYSNYKLTKDTSARAFSASIFEQSSFHNLGLYLANDFAKLDDSDLIVTSLLGIQYLDYKFDDGSKKYSSPLYPQGIEFTYKNQFQNKDYIVSGGIFINPTSSSDYQNAWVRWGDKYFYELNYINWSREEFKATMWGLSIIYPIGKFL